MKVKGIAKILYTFKPDWLWTNFCFETLSRTPKNLQKCIYFWVMCFFSLY